MAGQFLADRAEGLIADSVFAAVAAGASEGDRTGRVPDASLEAVRSSDYLGLPSPRSSRGAGASALACCAVQRRLPDGAAGARGLAVLPRPAGAAPRRRVPHAAARHTPLARAATFGRPTTLVFDLDPGPPATIVECCHVGLLLQGMFEGLGVQSWAKTSGSKGLQVYVPLNSDITFAQTKPFAHQVAELLERSAPDLVVSRQTKALRPGKVLIDWSQNDQHKTTVCVYSLRARDRPTVSTPVEWDEVRSALDSGDPQDLAFDSAQVLDQVSTRGDLLAPVLSLVQVLPPATPA